MPNDSSRELARIASLDPGMLLLPILILLVSASSSRNRNLVQDADRLAEIAHDGPEVAAHHFLAVCQAGAWATALDLLVLETREAMLSWGGGNLCSRVSAGAVSATLNASEHGNTIYVTFNWLAQDSDAIVEYQLLLTEIEGARLIPDDHKTHQQPGPMPITPASTPTLPSSANILTTESGE